jgi:hypothetical protein
LNSERGIQYSKLLQTASDLEAQHNAALSDAGLLGQRGVTSETASLKVSAIMGGFQLLIELLLYGCLYWCIWFEYRVYMEEVRQEEKKEETQKVTKPFFQQQTSFPPLASNEGNLPTNKPVVVAGFTNRTQSTHTPQHKQPQTIVTQQPQPTTVFKTNTVVFDYSQTKSNLKTYMARLAKRGYSDRLFDGVKRYASALIENGYMVDIVFDEMSKDLTAEVDSKNTPTLKRGIKYEIVYEGQVRIYYPELIADYLKTVKG